MVTSRARMRASTRAPAAIVKAKPGMSMVPLMAPSTSRSSDAARSPTTDRVRGMAVAIGERALTGDTVTAAKYATTRRGDHDESPVLAASAATAASVRANHAATSARAMSRTIATIAAKRASDGARLVGSSGQARSTSVTPIPAAPTTPRRARSCAVRTGVTCAETARHRDADAGEADAQRDERPRGRRRTTACAAGHDRASAPATPARPRASRRRPPDARASAVATRGSTPGHRALVSYAT